MYRSTHSAARCIRHLSRRAHPAPVLKVTPLPIGRSFSTSSPIRASEVPKNPLSDPEIQGFYEKIRNHQGAVDAMMKIREIMEEKGIDTSKPPSMMQMMKLSMDSEVREAGQNAQLVTDKKLVAQMKEAGVEFTPENLYGKVKP